MQQRGAAPPGPGLGSGEPRWRDPLVSTNLGQIQKPPWEQTEAAAPVQNLRGAPLQPGDRIYSVYEL
eukprot:8220195-Alexandrium_andersonii.AAC.1